MSLDQGIRDRIRQVLTERYAGNITHMAQSAGIGRSKLTRIVQNRTDKIDVSATEKIIRAAGVSRQWLYAGNGPMMEGYLVETDGFRLEISVQPRT